MKALLALAERVSKTSKPAEVAEPPPVPEQPPESLSEPSPPVVVAAVPAPPVTLQPEEFPPIEDVPGVKLRILAIKQAIDAGDCARACTIEQDLHYDVLRAVAARQCTDSAAVAKEALSTLTLSFHRTESNFPF